MEIRARTGANEGQFIYEWADDGKRTEVKRSLWWRSIRHEARVTWNLFKGSKIAYLFIPALISLFWLLICLVTTRTPNVTLEEQYIKEYIAHQEGHHEEVGPTIVDVVHMPVGMAINVALAIPFLDVNPLGAAEYIKTLEWILHFSTVPIKFLIITNEESLPLVAKVMAQVNQTSKCEFTYEPLTFSQIIQTSSDVICPQLGARAEFCEILLGNMTPLLFPYMLKDLDHVVYISRTLVFQDNIGYLYPKLKQMKRSKEGIGMAPEQSKTYMLAFSAWQRMNPSTKLGRPFPDGKPGFNPDLILMDLDKLRASVTYKSFFSEAKLAKLVSAYRFQSSSEVPSLGDMLNLMAVDAESLFFNLGCEWNRNSRDTSDVIDKKYNVCDSDTIHVWNGTPNLSLVSKGTSSKTHSRTLVASNTNE